MPERTEQKRTQDRNHRITADYSAGNVKPGVRPPHAPQEKGKGK